MLVKFGGVVLTRFGIHFAGVVIFLTAFLAAVGYTGFGNNVVFDPGAWQIANYRDRGRMAADLIAKRRLIGNSVDEVRSELGDPQKDWGSVYQYQIDLGWPMKSSSTYGLQVHFDSDRKVKVVQIVD